jgi:hypothetical protein
MFLAISPAPAALPETTAASALLAPASAAAARTTLNRAHSVRHFTTIMIFLYQPLNIDVAPLFLRRMDGRTEIVVLYA